MNLQPYLDDLESRISPTDEEALERQWLSFSDLEWNGPFFAPARPARPAGREWPKVVVNDAIDDLDQMVYSQLRMCSDMLADGTGELLCVRANYGTGIIPSMFGAEVFIMPREHDILPGTRPLPDGKTGIRAILEKRETNFSAGLAGRVFALAERYGELTRDYPNISRFVNVYDPDLQGPLALCEAMWGSELYMDLYDDEETVTAALDFLTDTYIAFTKKWKAVRPDFDGGHAVEWGMLHRGGTIIRNDAAMNISGDMYEEFIMPRDQRILDEFGGGVHFCGRGDHYIHHLAGLNSLSVINLSQPECNDMEVIYQNTVDRDIIIIGLRSDEVKRAVECGRDLRGRVNSGASMAAWVEKEKR